MCLCLPRVMLACLTETEGREAGRIWEGDQPTESGHQAVLLRCDGTQCNGGCHLCSHIICL
jgi:hypothetical protein